MYVDNLKNLRREASRHFTKKQKEYLKAKIDDLETNTKIKNIRDFYRDINEFKKGYQFRTKTVKDEGHLFTESYSILARWGKRFSHLLNVHGVNDVRQTETHSITTGV